MEKMLRLNNTIIIIILLLNTQIALGAENEYGIVKAWFNGKNATVEGIDLRVDEPSEIKVTVTSKINGNVHIKLLEPGITKAFDVISGPSKQDERIDNMGVSPGWSKTFTWKIKPNGNWKNGNAPINIFISFYSSNNRDQKPIEFTIANPHILDEQYPGSGSTPVQTSGITPGATEPKEAPFVPVIAVLALMIMIYLGKRR